MTFMFDEDFDKLDAAGFDDVLATGFAPAGEAGTAEHALNVAEALEFADADIYYDYEYHAESDGYPSAAAKHANISSLQSAAAHAAEVFKVLATYPDLLDRIQAAVEVARSRTPKI